MRDLRGTVAGIVGGVLMAAAPCQAIIGRHDVPQMRYIELGEQGREFLVQLALPADGDGAPMLYSGMGTLIASRWVVTAAHATDYLQEKAGSALRKHFVFVKGRGYAVERIVTHPQWDGSPSHDIALIELQTPVRDAHPVAPCRTAGEAGLLATLFGTGYGGNGRDGPREYPDGALRGATVRVESARDGVLRWAFHDPAEGKATPLEGISGPGDSGGPAIITQNGRACLAGVSSSQAHDTARGEGHYGANEMYTRVSEAAAWIDRILPAGAH